MPIGSIRDVFPIAAALRLGGKESCLARLGEEVQRWTTGRSQVLHPAQRVQFSAQLPAYPEPVPCKHIPAVPDPLGERPVRAEAAAARGDAEVRGRISILARQTGICWSFAQPMDVQPPVWAVGMLESEESNDVTEVRPPVRRSGRSHPEGDSRQISQSAEPEGWSRWWPL
jgi:hypothetical protein